MALALRSEADGLVHLAEGDLNRLWRLVAGGAPADEALHDLLPALVSEYGAAAAAAAADWYDQERARAAVRGFFQSEPLPASDRGSHALIGWALQEARDDATLTTLILGGVQRRITDHMRLTVTHSSVADPQARGWRRVGYGACEWCQQYLDGEVHAVAGYDFDAHDNCHCSVEPDFL